LRNNGVNQADSFRRLTQVASMMKEASPCITDQACYFFTVFRPTDGQDVGPGLGQAQSHRLSQTAVRSRHQGDTALKFEQVKNHSSFLGCKASHSKGPLKFSWPEE
jgi:hypothetical protein